MTVFFFWLSAFLIFYAYFGYPLSLVVIRLFRSRTVQRGDITPPVSVIITVHNEADRIRAKLDNTLQQDYPADRLQILVASDGSTDDTNSIVHDYADRGVELLDFNEQRGKESAQRDAVRQAGGEILVFSDVATRLDKTGLRRIVSNFADPSVGCVSSIDKVVSSRRSAGGEGLYVTYEMWLRTLETDIHSVVGLSGSFFAARKAVCQDFSGRMQSDFRTLLNSIRMGMRGIIDTGAVGYYPDIADPRKEYARKVRTVIRGLNVFFNHLEYANIARYGIFAYLYLCHKLLRWLVPLFMLILLAANLVLAFSSPVFYFLLMGHSLFYLAAYYGYGRPPEKLSIFQKIPLYFVTVNLSIAAAWVRFLRGETMVRWTPSKR